MQSSVINHRYVDGKYLEETGTWHAEDSPYKAKIVHDAINRNGIYFDECADIGCGAGKVIEILAEKYPNRNFVGYELSNDVDEIWKRNKLLKNLSYSHGNILDIDTLK